MIACRPGEGIMAKAAAGFWNVLINFAWISLIATGFIMFSVLTNASEDSKAASPEPVRQNSDQSGAAIYRNPEVESLNLLEDAASGRTLSQYYVRRQFLGSPPEIPHPDKVHGRKLECNMCHADGGWTELLKRMTPVTPHPEQASCEQCHLWPVTEILFRAIDWQSLPPPRLGRSYLPGAPPPIPHELQMRENCEACHVGPGTIVAIRMKHNWRGYCWQCHLPDRPVEPFRR
jgi:cytochrome c-type protein NapB